MPSLIFLTKENPFPPAGGAHIRDSHLIQILRETMDVEILRYAPETDEGDPSEAAMRTGDEATPAGVRVTRIRRTRSPIWQKALSQLRPEVQADYCPAMGQALRERAEPGKTIWISRLGMGIYLELAKKLGYRTILDQHQVETHILWNNALNAASRLKTAARGLTDFVTAAQCGLFEGKVCRLSDAVVASSDLDASRLLKLAPGAPVHVIPQSIDCSHYAPLRALTGRTILFSGALNYGPNIEGLRWYVSEVLPRLRGPLGGAIPKLVVAGSNPSSELYRILDNIDAELHPDPPSLLPFLADAAVVIEPIRSGRSKRFKILEAMASGRVMVSTPRGAEGLLLAPGYDIWIADGPDKFAAAIARLLQNPALRGEIAAHAAETADARYDWRCSRSLLESLFQRLEKPIPISG